MTAVCKMEAGIVVGYVRLNSTDCVEQGLLSCTKTLLSVITRTDRKKLEVILILHSINR